MDFRRLARRVRAILLSPRKEWPVIDAEPATVAALYRGYVLWLAALPALCGFVKGSLIGYSSAAFATARIGIVTGIGNMLFGYAFALVLVYLLALIVDGLAPNFGAQRDQTQAFKTVSYAFTAIWLSSLGELLPVFSALVLTAGAGYSIWLLFTGLPHTMQAPRARVPAYAAIIVVAAVLISLSLLVLRAGVVATILRLI